MNAVTGIQVLECGNFPIVVQQSAKINEVERLFSQLNHVFVLRGIKYNTESEIATLQFNPGNGMIMVEDGEKVEQANADEAINDESNDSVKNVDLELATLRQWLLTCKKWELNSFRPPIDAYSEDPLVKRQAPGGTMYVTFTITCPNESDSAPGEQ
jgi:hypothetical protein